MSHAHIRFVRPRLRGKGRRLFDFIIEKKMDEIFASSYLFPELSQAARSKLRHSLQRELAQLLSHYRQSDHPAKELRDLMDEVDGYIYGGVPEAALDCISEAIRIAEWFEEFQSMLDLIVRQEEVMMLCAANRDMAGGGIHIQADELIGKLKEQYLLRGWMNEIETLKQQTADRRLDRAKEMLASLSRLDKALSKRSELMRFHIRLYCHAELHEELHFQEQLDGFWKCLQERPGLLHHQDVRRSADALAKFEVGYLLYQRKEGEARSHIGRVKDHYSSAGLAVPNLVLELAALINVHRIMLDTDRLSLPSNRASLENELSRFQKNSILYPYSLRVIVVDYLSARNYSEALFWIHRFDQIKGEHNLPENTMVFLTARIFAHCFLEDWDEMAKTLRRAEYYARSRKCKTPLDIEIGNTIRRIYNDTLSMKPELKALASKVDLLRTAPECRIRMEMFDIARFLKRTLSAAP